MRIDDLKSMPGHLIRRAQQLSTSLFADQTAQFDLTSVQFIALVAIDEMPALDATRLAGLIHFDRATIGGVIARLERKGLIKRKQSKHDKRIKILETSDEGRVLIAACFSHVEEVQRRFLAPLNQDEQQKFMEMLRRICADRS